MPVILGRWEPFILGLVANVINDPVASVVGLRFIGGWPDASNPYILVSTEAQTDEGVRQYYRITVERTTPPPEDAET